jgi:hypothetical protein
VPQRETILFVSPSLLSTVNEKIQQFISLCSGMIPLHANLWVGPCNCTLWQL